MGPRPATISLVLLTLFVQSFQSSYSPPPSPECPAYFNGSLAGDSCSQEYTICVNGVRQASSCSDGYVFYGTTCVLIENSPECQVADDNEESENSSPDFDCSTKSDGVYSVGCVNEFVKCVAGYTYKMYCPGDLVYHAKYNECLESCEDIEGYEEQKQSTTPPAADDTEGYNQEDGEVYDEVIGEYDPSTTPGYEQPSQDPSTTEEPEPVEFDCTGLEDGIYADGCQPYFYECSNGIAYKKSCPAGTVYNPSQKTCDYDCTEAVTTTTQSYQPTTDAGVPSTTEEVTGYPEIPTTPQDDEPEPEYTTTPQEDVPSTFPQTTTEASTTAEYQTTPGFDDTDPTTSTTPTWTTTQAPIQVCQEGQVTTFGTCSSRFTRCQGNAIRSKQCPVDTLFETSLLLCVFELPQCQPTTVPITTYPTGPQPDIVVSPFDDDVHLRPRYNGRRPSYHHGNKIYDNPFFIPSHRRHHNRGRLDRRWRGPLVDSPFSTHFRGRAVLNDGFKDFRRARMGKLQYGEARQVDGNKRFLIDDSFSGPKSRYITSEVDRIFPKSRSSRRLGPREDLDGYEDGSGFAPKDLFGATRRKRSAYYGSEQQSGYGQQTTTQISARQAQVNQNCQNFTVPTFLTFGDCFGQFIYCSGNGVNRMAACPIGESFDKSIGECTETCGASSTVGATVTVGTQTTTITESPSEDATLAPVYNGEFEPSPTTTTAPSDDQSSTYTSTTQAPLGDRCTRVSTGLFAIGCSQKYIQCSNGAGVVRQCPASLYFHETISSCDFRDRVPECEKQDSSPTYAPVVVTGEDIPSSTLGYELTTAPGQDQPSYSPGYDYTNGPSQEQPSTTSGYETATSGPSDDFSSTTVGYGAYSPSDDQPTTYSPPVVPYNPVAPAQDQDACAGLSDGSHGQGCSSSFIICSSGRLLKSINCALGEGFDPSVQFCRTFNLIPAQACGDQETTTDSGLAQPLPYVTLENVLTTTTQTDTDDDVSRDSATTSSYYPTSAPYETEEATDATLYSVPSEDVTETVTESYVKVYDDDEDTPIEHEKKCTTGTRASVGFCVQNYLECSANEYLEKSCRRGKLFDAHLNKCVARVACGKEAIREAVQDIISATTTVAPKKIDGRCAHVDGEAVFALGSCSSNYVQCSYGSAKLQHCSGNQVFSNAKLECVSRDSTSECHVAQNPPVKSFYNNHEQSAYCDGKSDGLYGNKRDCSAILQCFGGELFEHPSCPSSLAFNELTGKCDYPQKVSGCENHGRTDGVCSEHGAFIADVDNCSVFYRCVWGRKVTMRCPSGTVFNPALSVCDWPSAVPSCGPSGESNDVPNDDSTTARPYYNNNNSGY